MEEILASIRRIISDDQPARPEPNKLEPARQEEARPETAKGEPDPMDAVLELTAPKRKAPEPHLINDDPLPNDLDFVDPSSKDAGPKAQDDIDALMNMAMEPEPDPEPVAITPQPMPDLPHEVVVPPVPPYALPPRAEERLMSDMTDRAVATAFSGLASTILTQNARTLEDLVREMLKPMIKTWLDDNLPTMVERLVRAEIERVARGGR
jgi:hypothetical protein